jgi:hypothetical protein
LKLQNLLIKTFSPYQCAFNQAQAQTNEQFAYDQLQQTIEVLTTFFPDYHRSIALLQTVVYEVGKTADPDSYALQSTVDREKG